MSGYGAGLQSVQVSSKLEQLMWNALSRARRGVWMVVKDAKVSVSSMRSSLYA